MPDGFGILGDLARHIGQTVTIFTTSGGESGQGFTGILASVNDRFVRLILQIGSAPGCALGNCCGEERERFNLASNSIDRNRNRIDCSGRTLGAIVDIPVDRIAAFVHNAVGSSGWV